VAFFTRYSFDKHEALNGLAIGAGVSKIGGRWLASSGLLDAPGLLPPSIAGETPEIKMVSRPLLNGFVSYGFDKHWVFRVNAYNLLDEVYAVGLQHAYELDPSSPTTFSFEAEYRFDHSSKTPRDWCRTPFRGFFVDRPPNHEQRRL